MQRMTSLLVSALLLAGCATRSISDSGYRDSYGRGSSNPLYKGELDELDLLGADPASSATGEELGSALRAGQMKVSVPKQSRVLLIQSGAVIPDQGMLDGLAKHYTVLPFSGVPDTERARNLSYGKSLRIAAAKGAARTIIVYWGVIEAGTRATSAKAVSWIPLFGPFVPDEAQELRVRLKIVVIDVESGRWDFVTPDSESDTAYSSTLDREQSDQEQVAKAKAVAYRAAADEIARRYAE